MTILAAIEWPAGDKYADPSAYRASERFWWHQSIAAELYSQHLAGRAANCTAGIAGNIKMSYGDVAKYLAMMLTWGEVKHADAPNDFEPETWVSLDPAEHDAHAQRVQREERAAANRNQHRWGI
jgi:hypothetical protein